MALGTAKQAVVFFDDVLENFEKQDDMLSMVEYFEPGGGDMQNSGNTIYRPVEQQRPSLSGWDLSGQETGIIEQAYLATLGTPTGDLIKLRADDLRDPRFWDRAGKKSGAKQASVLNKAIADAIVDQGTLFFRTNATSGYDVIAEAQVQRNERQLVKDDCYFMFNDRDNLKFGKDLAARQTIQGGRPEDVWAKGQIAGNVAEQDIWTGSYLKNVTGGADPATTVTSDQSFAPLPGTVVSGTNSAIVTNHDYRYATMIVAASASYSVGDKFQIKNSGTAIVALAKDDKTSTNQPMTFTINEIPDGTSITFSPRPIAADDSALSEVERAYSNVDTVILATATVNRVNIDASNKANIFWDKSSVEVLGGNIPANLMAEYDGMKVLSDTMPNGLTMYMFWDGSLIDLTFRYRLFTWYNVVVKDPANCGVCLTY
jgi:hypothetical protein